MSGETGEHLPQTQTEFPISSAEAQPETPPIFGFPAEQPRPPMRFPNFADVGLAALVLGLAWVGASVLTLIALHFHLLGISTAKQAATDIHYNLGGQTAWYLFALLGFALTFPSFWHKAFFAGVEWRISAALHMRWHLLRAAFFCVVLAIVDSIAMPGPKDAPIDEVFRRPDAAWLMAIFGITFAPFMEELIYRGFLLPAFCTAWDWATERIAHRPAPWPDAEGRTQWTLPAMAVGSVLTSIPFSLMHSWQNGGSIGPFLLLFCVSLVLCWVRLGMRSLAASTIVHASYNLILFAMMFAGTDGFKHMDKM